MTTTSFWMQLGGFLSSIEAVRCPSKCLPEACHLQLSHKPEVLFHYLWGRVLSEACKGCMQPLHVTGFQLHLETLLVLNPWISLSMGNSGTDTKIGPAAYTSYIW